MESERILSGDEVRPAGGGKVTADLTLTATDFEGRPATSNTNLVVNNGPVASAGTNQTVVEGSTVTIGAMTRHAEVARSAEVKKAIPALAALASGR